MSARTALRNALGVALTIPGSYALGYLIRRADEEHHLEVERERDELLAWAADRGCEYGPGDEDLPCVEDNPDYRCWPCAARGRLYSSQKAEQT